MASSHRALLCLLLGCTFVVETRALLPNVRLQPKTIADFDAYAAKVEQELAQRWSGKRSFLAIDESPDERKRVLGGELIVEPGSPKNPLEIDDGLIHDWSGDVFIPNASLQSVLATLQDFDQHAKIYPEVVRSRLVRRDGNHILGFWRLEKKGQMVPVVLDANDDATYQKVASDEWTCRAYARDIREVQNPGTENEKELPAGEGSGVLWRLYAYWSLKAVNGGVLAECRTLSLSRAIPAALNWIVKPFVKDLPRESLSSTLLSTKKSVAK